MVGKHFFSQLVLFFLILIVYSNTALATVNKTVKFGDINSDGSINEADNELILQHSSAEKSEDILQKHPGWVLKGQAALAADVNRDGKIDVSDNLIILRHIKNMVSKIITLDFYENGGTPEIGNIPVIYKLNEPTYYPSLPSVKKTGNTFMGWYTSLTGGTKVTEETAVTMSWDHRLYAHWKPDIYYITYNANGGNGAPVQQTKEYGSALTLSEQIPYRTGYTFNGWATSADSTIVRYVPGSQYSNNEELSLYAIWTKDPNESEVEIQKQPQKIKVKTYVTETYREESTFTLGATAPGKLSYQSSDSSVVEVESNGIVSMKGCGFAEIRITAAETETYYSASETVRVEIQPAQTSSLTVTSNQNGTLTAQWKKDSVVDGYQIQYSEDSKMEDAVDLTVQDFSQVMKSISGLKQGIVYYVRVRGYKISGQTTLYGAWSEIKAVAVRSEKKVQTIQVKSAITKVYKKKDKFSLGATAPGKLSYSVGNKKVVQISAKGKVTIVGYGKTMVTIRAAGTSVYDPEVKNITISIVPKTPLLSVSSSKKGSMNLNWKRDSSVTRYEIQYSTDPKFPTSQMRSGKTKNNTIVKTTVNNLASKKVYYVRIRSCKTITGGYLYSPWSVVKKVKIV